MDKEDVDVLLNYIKYKTYPEKFTKDQKRRIREKSKSFSVKGGDLIHIGTADRKTRVIFEGKEKIRLIEIAHQGIGGCHFGQVATITKIAERFWWPDFASDVRKYVRACLTCQKSNPRNKPQPAMLHPISVSHIFHRWGIDLVGPLQVTPNGKRYIIVATEYVTKWAEVEAISDKSAEKIHKFLMQLVFRFGSFTVLLHDQGREFNNNLVRNLCEKLKISVAMTSAYHPQTNG